MCTKGEDPLRPFCITVCTVKHRLQRGPCAFLVATAEEWQTRGVQLGAICKYTTRCHEILCTRTLRLKFKTQIIVNKNGVI